MKKNIPILISGVIMTLTTILHLTGGQMDHVVPLLASELESTDKAVLLGVWHMISVALCIMSFWLIRHGLQPSTKYYDTMRFIAWLNVLFAFVFILVSLIPWTFAPQWILFLPIGILILFGLRNKTQSTMYLSSQ